MGVCRVLSYWTSAVAEGSKRIETGTKLPQKQRLQTLLTTLVMCNKGHVTLTMQGSVAQTDT